MINVHVSSSLLIFIWRSVAGLNLARFSPGLLLLCPELTDQEEWLTRNTFSPLKDSVSVQASEFTLSQDSNQISTFLLNRTLVPIFPLLLASGSDFILYLSVCFFCFVFLLSVYAYLCFRGRFTCGADMMVRSPKGQPPMRAWKICHAHIYSQRAPRAPSRLTDWTQLGNSFLSPVDKMQLL